MGYWDLETGETEPPMWHEHKLDKFKTKRALKLVGTTWDRIVPRAGWGARPPTSVQKMDHTAPFFMALDPEPFANHVHFTHTQTDDCTDSESCRAQLRAIQDQHMAAGSPDILHSFLVGGDGALYEGRGWDAMTEVPEDFTLIQCASLQVALIGDYSKKKPSKEIVKLLREFFFWGVMNKKIDCCFHKTYDYTLNNMFMGPSYTDD